MKLVKLKIKKNTRLEKLYMSKILFTKDEKISYRLLLLMTFAKFKYR